MTRLSTAFSKPHPALVTFITAGDGDTTANLRGSGDKDIYTVAEAPGTTI